jgi:tungstate transport system substrate-binding protein
MSKTKNIKLVIASTTSTQNSGLFDVLIPAYEKTSCYGVSVEIISVGTGQAIRIAKRGQADLLFVHDPFREEKFVDEGFGVNRRQVMHNDFVILGPKNDPAKIKSHTCVIDAFELIADKNSPFVSRGDDSGTNVKEQAIWEDAGVDPKGKDWYFEARSPMKESLFMADTKKAYILSDRGTFINYESRVGLKVLVEGDELLINQYSVIAVNPARFPHVKYREAMEFIAFVTSPDGQTLIARYKKQGVNAFIPDAVPKSLIMC